MERVPDAKGHAGSAACPLKPLIPEYPTKSIQRSHP
jgi:hypothetical protein